VSDPDAVTRPLPTTADETAVPHPAPRKRRRGVIALVVVLIVLVLLVVAFFVGDAVAKQYATAYVRDRVATALELKSTKSVHVDLGSGSLIFQALGGRIDDVRVTVDPLTVEGLTGSAVLVAHGVPLDSNTPVTRLSVAVTAPVSTISSKLGSIPELKNLGATVSISGKHVLIGGKLSLFGQSIPLGLSLTPGVSSGRPTFAIDAITIGKNQIPASQLDTVLPGFSDLVKSGQSFCIASALPKDFVLTGMSVHDKALTYTFTGDGVKLNEASLSKKGTC
jgi:hypothetical protein